MAIKQPQVPNKQGRAQMDARNLPGGQIVQRIAIPHHRRRNWLLHPLKRRDSGSLSRMLIGYTAAVLGVTVASLCIGLVLAFAHVENLSLVYLPVVLWLAVSFGRGPAIMASFLAFLAYDFFFVPPFYRLSVADPAQWISLLALLVTALVIGQLTATVRAQADEALVSQQRTARLYALAQMIATASDEEQLFQALVRRVVEVFRSTGITAAALLLPDTEGNLVTRAAEPANEKTLDALSLKVREQALLAKWALLHGGAVGRDVAKDKGAACTIFYVPLGSGGRIIGILGIVGRHDIHRLVTGMSTPEQKGASGAVVYRSDDPQAQLFAAFCGQIALALERTMLQREAIHAEALRESDRLKNVLLGSVTHDLRTPLAAIKAATSSLLEPGITWREEDRREFIESVDASVDRLSHLVSNLLDLSRLESGTAVPQEDWHLIGDVIATVLDRLDLAGQAHDHKIEVDVSDALPLVLLDHGQIERVLTNLLENALKYSPPGSVVRVAARMVGDPAELELRVSDQGIGIPADQLEIIFEKFYRVPRVRLPWAPAPSPAGTGLGLAICASIVQAHKGRIWAESRPGEGSIFVFTLPIPADRPQGELPELDLSARQLAMPAGATGEQRADASAPAS